MAKRTLSKQMLLQRIGLDGKELNPTMGTPQVGGFKFMDTSPSPALSALGASPLMTWGQLDSTPARLDDGSATPSVISGVPAFHIPSPSKREQLAHKLADKASRQRTRDRNEAVKRVHSGISSPSLSLLSPAARRLLATSSGRAGSSSRPGTGSSAISFTQSPMAKSFTPRRLASDLVVVRRPTSGQTTGVCHSPAVAADAAKKIAPTHPDESVPVKIITPSNEGGCPPNQSITDNLLNLRPLHSQTPAHNG
ncbi:protein DGCR14 [Clonorchis sinensis]|nr:protein DGCR14 [Clonorchis sinensis]